MNELTRAANNQGGIPWLVPVLLGAVTFTGAGNYAAINTGNEQLALLNASVSETNRLAEMRGTVSAEISTLKAEVDKLRSDMARKHDIKTAREDFSLLKEILVKLRADLENRATKAVVQELTSANRKLIIEISKFGDRMVTQDQFSTLVGRVDAISRRITAETKQ